MRSFLGISGYLYAVKLTLPVVCRMVIVSAIAYLEFRGQYVVSPEEVSRNVTFVPFRPLKRALRSSSVIPRLIISSFTVRFCLESHE